jgi:hypothetical protein
MKALLSTLLYLCLSTITLQAGAVSLSLQPATQTASPGDSVSLDLVIDGLGDYAPDSVGTFYLDIHFDPTALSFEGYTLGPYLGDLLSGEASDVSYGLLGDYVQIFEESNLSGVELDVLQPGSFTLASLDFSVDVLALGDSTTVSIGTIWGLSDGNHDQQLEVDGTNVAVIGNPAASVAEPGTLLLINLGLLGLLAVRKRVGDG